MMKVARFIANIEPTMSEQADVLFMARFDCSQDFDTIQKVSNKFNVHHKICRRQGEGWPFGCNELFFGTMDWIYEQREAEFIPDYKAILIMESDAGPLVPDWIAKLSAGWDEAKVCVLGALQPEPLVHINGNALYSGDLKFLKRVSREISGCTPHGGYDYVLHKEWTRLGCADSPLMRSWWRCPAMTREIFDDLSAKGVVFLHGVKGDSLMERYLEKFPR